MHTEVKGLVLRTVDLKESDRLLTIFTEEKGVVTLCVSAEQVVVGKITAGQVVIIRAEVGEPKLTVIVVNEATGINLRMAAKVLSSEQAGINRTDFPTASDGETVNAFHVVIKLKVFQGRNFLSEKLGIIKKIVNADFLTASQMLAADRIEILVSGYISELIE